MKTALWITILQSTYALIPATIRQSEWSVLDVIEKRTDFRTLPILNGLGSYSIDFQLGTPPQRFLGILDTGSSGVLIQSGIDYPRSSHRGFFYKNSTTFVNSNDTFDVCQIDGSSLSGFYGKDNFMLNGILLEDFEFAISTQGISIKPIIGLGIGCVNMGVVEGEMEDLKTSFIWKIKNTGAISHAAFSLWLNSVSEMEGQLIFGGIDRSKMASNMYIFPIVSESKNFTLFNELKLHEIHSIDAQKNHRLIAKTEMSILLDSSIGITQLPLQLILPFFQEIGAVVAPDGTYNVDCEALVDGGGIGLVFSGVEFIFEFHDIVIPSDIDFKRCVPGVVPGDAPMLGSNFLRSLYVVYDVEKFEIGIAIADIKSEYQYRVPHYEPMLTGIPGVRAPLFNDTKVGSAYTVYSNGINYPSQPSDTYTTLGDVTKIGIRVPYQLGGGILQPGELFDIEERLGLIY